MLSNKYNVAVAFDNNIQLLTQCCHKKARFYRQDITCHRRAWCVVSEWRSLSCMVWRRSKADRDGRRPFFGLRGLIVSRFVLIGRYLLVVDDIWLVLGGVSFLVPADLFCTPTRASSAFIGHAHHLILRFGRCLLWFQGFRVGLYCPLTINNSSKTHIRPYVYCTFLFLCSIPSFSCAHSASLSNVHLK